jgi:flagellar protein FlaF
MGAASLVATAVGIFLIFLSAYVLVGGTLNAAKTVSAAQKDLSDREVEKVHTTLSLVNNASQLVSGKRRLYIEVKNTGSEPVTGISNMQVYVINTTEPRMWYLSNKSGQWFYQIRPDTVNPNILDPDEMMNITIYYNLASDKPTWAMVVTPNGMSGSKYV